MYFLLLVLGISLNFGSDVDHKQGRFPKTLSEKSLEFVLSKRGGPVALNLGLVLLPAEVDPILEERGRKRDTFGLRGTGRVKMILALSTEIVALHMQVLIIQVGVTGLEGSLLGGGVCLAMFLALDKQF